MPDKIIPINFIENDLCTNCNNKSIELYDYFNNPLNYSMIVRYNNFNSIDKKNIYIMKCKKCGKEYNIKWTHGGSIPIPMRNEIDLENFKLKFKIKDKE